MSKSIVLNQGSANRNGKLYVAALGSSRRPAASTRLYHAPLMNVDAFGRVCTGTADLPASCGIPDIPAWERVMHDTYYSHVNQNHTLNQTLLHARPLARPRNIGRTHRVRRNRLGNAGLPCPLGLGHPRPRPSGLEGESVRRRHGGSPECRQVAVLSCRRGLQQGHRLRAKGQSAVGGLSWDGFPFHFQPTEEFIGGNSFGQVDLFVTCVDKAQFRADFAKLCRGRGFHHRGDALFLDTGNGSASGQVILGHCCARTAYYGNKAWLPNVFDYYPGLDGMDDDDTPSCGMEEAITRQSPPVNRMIADAAYALLFNMIRFGSTDSQGCYIDTQTLAMTPIRIPG